MVEVRYFAGAAEKSGCTEETFELDAGSTIGALSAAIVGRHGATMADVLRVSAFLVGDDLIRDPAATCGDRVDVLPPFAGG